VRRPDEEHGRVVRVTWVGNTPLCFGDGSLADLEDRERVFVDVGTGTGTLQNEFAARVRVLASAVVPDDAILELLEHVSLGHTPDEVSAALARHRERRVLALDPPR
jgi:hypothetical protein